MCDYSLMAIPNRLAEEGESLVAHRFPTGSVGFASPEDLCKTVQWQGARPPGFWSALKNFFSPPKTNSVAAVCVPPGARLMLQDIPARLQHDLGVDAVEEVTFTQRAPQRTPIGTPFASRTVRRSSSRNLAKASGQRYWIFHQPRQSSPSRWSG